MCTTENGLSYCFTNNFNGIFSVLLRLVRGYCCDYCVIFVRNKNIVYDSQHENILAISTTRKDLNLNKIHFRVKLHRKYILSKRARFDRIRGKNLPRIRLSFYDRNLRTFDIINMI